MNVFRSQKKRKGFSLVELIVVILIIAILAVAVFAGGSAAIKKSQVSRTTSDLHNFSIAIESAMNETPSVANMKAKTLTGATGDLKKIVDQVNANLAADYQLEMTPVTNASDTSNLKFVTGDSYVILKSAKTDAWGNNYYAIFDFGERHCEGQSDFYITVVSAGPNAQTVVGGAVESDDLFLLVQYSDGDVSAVIYNVAADGMTTATTSGQTYTIKALAKADTTVKGVTPTDHVGYAGGKDNTTYTYTADTSETQHIYLPVNF